MQKVGVVSHFYTKIKVAVIDLSSKLSVGERILFIRGGEELFEQDVESIQLEHEKKKTAKKGDCIGLKTVDDVKEGAEVYKIKKAS